VPGFLKSKPAVLTAITVLSEAMPAIPVSADMPAHRPNEFIRVSPAGGTQPNQATDNPHLLIELFAVDTETVEDMFLTASQALKNAGSTFVTTTKGDVFVRCWDNQQGPVERAHPEIVDRERWQFHGDLLVKAN
jgi:hypothetical protein